MRQLCNPAHAAQRIHTHNTRTEEQNNMAKANKDISKPLQADSPYRTISFEIEGIMQQLMSNGQLIDPLNPWVKKMTEFSRKTKKVDEDHIEMQRLRYHGSFYMYEDDNSKCVEGRHPYWPSANIHACLKTAAKFVKQGKVVDSAILVDRRGGSLMYDGPRTRTELWEDPRFVHKSPCKRGIIVARPCFQLWRVVFAVQYAPELISRENVIDLVKRAGAFIGLSEWPRRNGLFEVRDIADGLAEVDPATPRALADMTMM